MDHPRLIARYALFQTYGDSPAEGWIEVQLEPFTFFNQTFSTSIRLDGIEGVDFRLQKAAGKQLEFPYNPEPGYIDGSIYFYGRHHPVDVHRLEFGPKTESTVPLLAVGRVTLEGHPDIPPFPLELRSLILLEKTPVQLEALVKAAVAKTGATSPRQLGKVMAEIKPHLQYEGEPAEAAAITLRILLEQPRA